MINKSKSVGLAFALAILFGPVGLLYASIAGGIIMSVLTIFSFLFLPSVGWFLAWIGGVAWAVRAVENANQKAVTGVIINQGGAK